MSSSAKAADGLFASCGRIAIEPPAEEFARTRTDRDPDGRRPARRFECIQKNARFARISACKEDLRKSGAPLN
jgi:hypothetical protein